MDSIIVVVADLPTRIEWVEKHYADDCELAWFKTVEDMMEMFPSMESSGRLQVVITEQPLNIATQAMILGPTQLNLGYSDSDLRMLIDNALTVAKPLMAAYA